MNSLTEVQLTSIDTSVSKTELFDVDLIREMIDSTTIPKLEKDKLRKMCKAGRYGELMVLYKLGKDCKHEFLGRLCPIGGVGLQNVRSDLRAALAKDRYWDVDMINAQPVLLRQYADQNGWKCSAITHYIEHREELLSSVCETLECERWFAKEKVIRLFFGAGVDETNGMPTFFVNELFPELRLIMKNNWDINRTRFKWLEKQPNHYGKALAYILQTIERNCLLSMDRALSRRGRTLDVYIHDGGLVRKKEGEAAFPNAVLKEVEEDVFSETGFRIGLAVKPLETSFVRKPQTDTLFVEVPSSVLVDDAFAAKEFAKLMGEFIILDKGRVWVFDEGLWSCDKDQLKRVVTNCGNKLVFTQGEMPPFNYSGCVKRTAALMDKLPDVLPRRDGFFDERVHSDITKLLFPNGIYDFKTGMFTPEFDPSIVFTFRMPRPFTEKDQELVDEIRRVSFTESFSNDENRDMFLHALMRGAIGDVLWKKLAPVTGWGNSGKGMIATLVHTSYGAGCSDFNGNNLLFRSSQGESARECGWMLANSRSRFAFGSEIMVKGTDKTPCIDGNLIKSISSGVDKIKGRGVYEKESEFVNKATFFMFCQDLPNIAPAEKTVMDRIIPIEMSYSFVADPQLPYERKSDPNMAHKYAQAAYGDAFFWLMVEEYEKWRLTGFAEPKMGEVILESRTNFVDVVDYRGVLEEKGFVLGDPEKFVLFKDIYPHFTCSKTMLGRNLTAFGLVRKDKKVDGRKEVVYFGIERV